MIQSMTGYGKAETILEAGKLTIEIKSLNGKNADISIKTALLPKDKELAVRQLIAQRLQRGNIDFFITFEANAAESAKEINADLVMSYYRQIMAINTRIGQEYPFTDNADAAHLLGSIIRFPDVIEQKKQDVINDGKVNGEGSVFCSLTEKSDRPKDDWFGYVWDEPQTIGMMSFHYGCMEEFGGWYSDMWVEALDDDGQWRKINAEVIPSLPESDEVFFQPHFVEYLFEFAPVTTRGIRIKGHDKVEHHWHQYTKNVSSFICVSEVQAYAAEAKQVRMSKAELMDRIKGGWAGQTIGVVYGAPTEFKFTGTTIQDYQPIPWSEGYVRYWWDKKPGRENIYAGSSN